MNDLIAYAKGLSGTLEWKNGSNPKIVQMFADAGHPEVVNDDTAWCAAFVGSVLKQCGYDNTGSLLAKSYLNFGEVVDPINMTAGDIVIWQRGDSTWQGHVEFVVSRRGAFVDVIGGNVQDQVRAYTRRIDNKLLGVRRPIKTSLNKLQPAPTAVQVAKHPATVSIFAAIIAAIAYYFGVSK